MCTKASPTKSFFNQLFFHIFTHRQAPYSWVLLGVVRRGVGRWQQCYSPRQNIFNVVVFRILQWAMVR